MHWIRIFRLRSSTSAPIRCLAAAVVVLASACRDRAASDGQDARAPLASPVVPPVASRDEGRGATLDLVDRLSRCEVDHGGVLVDLGSPTAQGWMGNWSLAPDPSFADSERDGESWVKVSARNLSLRFVLEEPTPIFVGLRARGGAARNAAVTLDGKPLGTLSFVRGQARIVNTRPSPGPVPAGWHNVGVRFAAAPRGQTDPLAEVDWVRMGTWEDESRTYAPPTLNQIVANASLAGVPHRSVALRAPSTVRCTASVAPGARLRLAMGFEGQGEGEGELRVLRDGEAPVSLHAQHVVGGDRAEWTPVDVPLDTFGGKLITVELRSRSGAPGGRVLFGDPTLYLPSREAPTPPARLVVLIAMAGLDRAKLADHSPYPALAELERSGVTFDSHRAPSTVSAGVVASLLTGLSSRAHGVEDPGARLPGSLTTIGVAARDGSVQTAMFSGCPTTFEAFGFARGWDKYATFSPVEGAPAVAPITEATRWTIDHLKGADARALVVVHARGGHPPWDVTINEAAKLPPSEYSGPMEPRRAAQLIARVRARHSRFRLSEGDRTRMWSIYDAAMAGQDRALGQLVDALKKASLWEQTLLVVTGDVSTASDNRAPFGDAEDLSESLLRIPLWVHFPGGALAGTRVTSPTAMMDISRTVLASLHLPTPQEFEGVDLFATASGLRSPGGRSLVAALGARYSLRLGDFVLSGTAGKQPTLCDVQADPACEVDRFERMPRAGAFLFREMFDAELEAQKQRHPREPATVDAATAAALQVWGE